MFRIFFGLFCLSHPITFIFSTVQGAVEIQKLSRDVNDALKQISEGSEKDVEGLYRRVGSLITTVNKTIHEIDSSENELIRALDDWTIANTLSLQMGDLTQYKTIIDVEYEKLDQHLKENCSKCIADLANGIEKKDPGSVRQHIEDIYFDFALSEESDNSVNRLLKYLQENRTLLCSLPLFPQQIVYSDLKYAIVAEIKSYVLQIFAYNYMKIVANGTVDQKIREVENRYSAETKMLFETFQKLIENSPTVLWKCDPPQHILGETYEQMTKLIEGYILNEENLSSDGGCFQDCSAFKYVTNAKCRDHSWCEKQPKCPKIVDCIPVRSPKLTVCLNERSSEKRRYKFVQLTNENKYWGNATQANSCSSENLDVFRKLLFFKCDYCFCKCDHKSKFSDRYINLRPVLADFENNRVITGLRFIKHNRIIHLQVQDGILLPSAKINNSSVRWVPVDNYKITDRKAYDGQDFHTFTYEERTLDLIDLKADSGHVVIGVAFHKMKHRITLQMLQAPFDFETGKLMSPSGKGPKYNITHKKLQLFEPDVPIKSSKPSVPDWNGKYVEFTHSDIEKDGAQTTVPFFDIQPVVSFLPVPLSAVGIFHKGRKGYGGFIAPKIIAYDIADHLHN